MTNKEIIDKLLWGRNPKNSIERDVMSACAIFTRFGFEDDVTEQRNYIAKDICKIEPKQFYNVINKFYERGLIEKRGKFISIKPFPLSIHLASEFWKNRPPENALEIINGFYKKWII